VSGLTDLLVSEAAGFGIDITAEMCGRFNIFMDLLLEWNKKFNLTSITDEREIILKHFADSLAAAELIPDGADVIDVGSGAGFPGIPLAIVRPDITVTLLDSTGKKVLFQKEVAGRLGLSNISCVQARAEEAGRRPDMRGSFDAAVSRAVAPLDILIEYCAPFVKTGGVFLAYKGSGADGEIKSAAEMIKKTGGEIAGVKRVSIDAHERAVVVIKKVRDTPGIYPRKNKEIIRKTRHT